MEKPERLLLMKESKEKEKLTRIMDSQQFFLDKIQQTQSQLKVR